MSAPPTALAATIEGLRSRHQALLSRSLAGVTLVAPDRLGLIEELVEAGRATPPGRERDWLRRTLFQWSAEAVARGDGLSETPTLAAFEQDAVDAAASGLKTGSSTSAANTERSTTSAGPPNAYGSEPAHSSDASAAWDMLKRLSVDQIAKPEPEPPPVPSDVEALARARAIIRIGALARQWRASADSTKTGYLLTGKALVEASLYESDDPDIQAFVEASEVRIARDRSAKLWRLGLGLAFGVVALVVAIVYLVRWKDYVENEAEKKSVISKERQRVADQIGAALDALNGDQPSLAPLKELLLQRSDRGPASLDRLAIAPDSPTRSSAVDSQASGPRPPRGAAPVSVPVPTDGIGACTGWLWFGGQPESKLENGMSPARLQPGDNVQLRSDDSIRLRADKPSPTYAMAPQVGVVPANARVTVASAPITFQRPRGTQYWAQVTVPRQFCSTVFLQYIGSEQRRDAALAALAALGVQTPPAEQVAAAKNRREIRFFWEEDRVLAQLAADALRDLDDTRGSRAAPRLVPLLDAPVRPSQGTVEAWFDLGD